MTTIIIILACIPWVVAQLALNPMLPWNRQH
jgi:hypothetical protein